MGRLGPRGRVLLDSLICVAVVGLAYVLLSYGYGLTLRTMTQLAPATQIIMGYVYMAIPVSGAIILLNALFDIFRNVRALATGDMSLAVPLGTLPDAEAD
jgi:TRAP-type C4-dicarboxylate transport system permease small subunit